MVATPVGAKTTTFYGPRPRLSFIEKVLGSLVYNVARKFLMVHD